MEPMAALAADGKGTAAHDASAEAGALLGVEAPPIKQADQGPSAEMDSAGKQEASAGEKAKASVGEKPAEKAKASAAEKPAEASAGEKAKASAAEKGKASAAEKPAEASAGEKGKASAGDKPAPSDDSAGKQRKVSASAEEKLAYEDPVGEDKKAAATVDLPVDMVLAVVARLPSKAAWSSALLSKTYRDRLREPVFLKSHLAPRNRFFVGDAKPNTIVLQPAPDCLRQGYTHLTIVPQRATDIPIPNRLVRAAFDDDQAGYYEYSVTYADDGPLQVGIGTPPPFFCSTVPNLDLALLASEGRLLLAHSPKHGLFLCNASEDRCVRLPSPPPEVDIDSRRTAAALRYQLGSWGQIGDVDVVLLSPLPSGHVALLTFSTNGGGAHGGWVLTDIGEESVLAALAGVSAPGIYASEPDAFYWIDDRTGSLIQYVVGDHLLAVVSPPPETDGYPSRKGWSLGSTGGVPRLSAFSVPAQPQGFANINGIVSVWIKKQIGWVLVKEVSVPLAFRFGLYHGLELPIDVARANGEFLMVKKDRQLLWRDLMRDGVEFVSSLYLRDDSELNRIYSRFKAFSVCFAMHHPSSIIESV